MEPAGWRALRAVTPVKFPDAGTQNPPGQTLSRLEKGTLNMRNLIPVPQFLSRTLGVRLGGDESVACPSWQCGAER